MARATALAAGAKVGALRIILALDMVVVEAGIGAGIGPGVVALGCYDGEATSWMGESVGLDASDFAKNSGAGSALAGGLGGVLLKDGGTVMLEWLPRVVVEEGVDGSLRELAKQK